MHQLIQDKKLFMNTFVEFSAWTSLDRYEVYNLFEKGYRKFKDVVSKFSRFDPDSELSTLNSSQGKKVKVTNELFDLVELAIRAARQTSGAFDPTVIDFLETYGYDARYNFQKLQNKTTIEKEIKKILLRRPSYNEIEIDRERLQIRLAPNQRLDLGGIGKGYAIDLAYKVLRPAENFVINAGGDIRTRGNYQDAPWRVGLKAAPHEQTGTVLINNKAICCSGSWARKVRFFHHLIDPTNGKPAEESRTVFVIADKATIADAWATAIFASEKKCLQTATENKLQILIRKKNKQININNFPIK
ncbi:MAG: FAD:protein FMN transferase [Candidatus Dojkabacteria bacterium]|nr:FAD:protein FMN transferase [Candidatus Dojkabacteria bacterium]